MKEKFDKLKYLHVNLRYDMAVSIRIASQRYKKTLKIKIEKNIPMKSNVTTIRPEKQAFIRFPLWIAQNTQFSTQEKGLLIILLACNDYFTKENISKFCNNGERSIDSAWAGLQAKGVIVQHRTKQDNRFVWHYSINLEKNGGKTSKNRTIPVFEKAIVNGDASLSELTPFDLGSLGGFKDNDGFIDFNPPNAWDSFAKKDELTQFITEKSSNELSNTERHNLHAANLIKDTALIDYLKDEGYNVLPTHITAFHKRLNTDHTQHLLYAQYAQHFRNWLPTYFVYQDKAQKKKATAKDDKDKCGTNKFFNVLRVKIRNPQADYMTYQGWVNDLCAFEENIPELSEADKRFKKEMFAHKQAGTLLLEYKKCFNAKSEVL